MPKAKRRKLAARAVTHEEVSKYSDTQVLFKSNLFRLQQAELLKEVSPFGEGTQPARLEPARLEAALRVLREEVLALPSTELSWEQGSGGGAAPAVSHPHLSHLSLASGAVRMAWAPPAKVELVGSYLLRTCAAPALNVDVSIELPAACFLEKDYLDGRYVDKRLLYLTHLAQLLHERSLGKASGTSGKKAKAKAKAAQADAPRASVVSSAAAPAFVALPHMQSTRWPVLQIALRDPAHAGANGDGNGEANGDGAHVIDGWSVRLIPSLAAGVFTDVKLRAPRCNLRVLGSTPSPTYNNLLRLESGYSRVLAQLHATYAAPPFQTPRIPPPRAR
jgi:hypothetical protein